MNKKNCVSIFVLFLIFCGQLIAQDNSGYNPHSVNPVHESQKLFKKTLWWRMDLEEKQNKPFFARNRELSRIIIEAVKIGKLFPYTNDSLKVRMSKETFLENLKLPEQGGGLSEEEAAAGFTDDFSDDWGSWGDEGGEDDSGGEESSGGGIELAPEEFSPRDFSIIEIKEDLFFDRNRSRMYNDIMSIGLFLPADKNPALYEKPLAFFRYKDLVKMFNEDESAVWYNPDNIAQNRNLADAFDLRLWSAILTKINNPDDERIAETYDESQREGIIASQQLEYELADFESELWEN